MTATPGCDDLLYEVSVSLPVILRFTAPTELDARLKYAACQVQIAGPHEGYAAIGFPLEFTITEVEQASISLLHKE